MRQQTERDRSMAEIEWSEDRTWRTRGWISGRPGDSGVHPSSVAATFVHESPRHSCTSAAASMEAFCPTSPAASSSNHARLSRLDRVSGRACFYFVFSDLCVSDSGARTIAHLPAQGACRWRADWPPAVMHDDLLQIIMKNQNGFCAVPGANTSSPRVCALQPH